MTCDSIAMMGGIDVLPSRNLFLVDINDLNDLDFRCEICNN